MNRNIAHLYEIARKTSRLIIGLMSGTSLDGLDVALCRIEGHGTNTSVKIEAFTTVCYDDHFKQNVRGVFSKQLVNLERLTVLNAWIARQHSQMILDTLKEWKIEPKQVDLIASHGQSVYHAPRSLHPDDEFDNATLQIGDGDHLAVLTGIITLSDFRQKHIAAGGEGAPLAVYGDYFIFSKEDENRLLLNIGGIANFTWLPGNPNDNHLFSTDTGPGNTLMDALAQKVYGIPCDRNAAIAAGGKINDRLLNALLDHPFFVEPFPKTTGPELFNLAYLDKKMSESGQNECQHQDIMATLNRFTAVSIANAINATVPAGQSYTIYTSGGGMHNPLLMQHLRELLPAPSIHTTDELAIQPDAKEAVLFAILANEAVAGGETNVGAGDRKTPFVSMGKISFPR